MMGKFLYYWNQIKTRVGLVIVGFMLALQFFSVRNRSEIMNNNELFESLFLTILLTGFFVADLIQFYKEETEKKKSR